MNCSYSEGNVSLGEHELDPCVYEEVERYENVTVVISRCKKCGKLDIGWVRQDNTRKV